MTKQLDLGKIRIDGGTQLRVSIDYATVDEYAAAYLRGDEFPPLKVFYDGADYWLADGFHRYHAGKKLSLATVGCDIEQGSVRDAILYACGANQTNGLRRTNADKRVAVMKLLHDPEWKKCSNNWIGEKCGVDDKTVGAWRKQVAQVRNSEVEKRQGRDGKMRPATNPKRRPPKKVDLHVPPIDADEPKSEPAKPAATPAKTLKAFDNERNLIRALADLATLVKQTRYTAEFDKGRLAHELNQWANDIAEQTEAAESAA